MKSTSAVSTIVKFERIFATHGLPHIIKSDNGPPFNSNDIRLYMKVNGIKHQRITPLWRQAYSEVENFMKPMEKAIRAARIEKKLAKRTVQFSIKLSSHPSHKDKIVTS